MKRKFKIGDEVMSRGAGGLWSAATVTGYFGKGYYYVREKTGLASERPCLKHATSLVKGPAAWTRTSSKA